VFLQIVNFNIVNLLSNTHLKEFIREKELHTNEPYSKFINTPPKSSLCLKRKVYFYSGFC